MLCNSRFLPVTVRAAMTPNVCVSAEESLISPSTSGEETRNDDDSLSVSEVFAGRRTELLEDDEARNFIASIPLSSTRSLAWDHWKRLGQPRFIVAPMVDNSELPFRLLCRRYGAQAAYTPMLHARIFAQSEKYRSEEFTTCEADRPLFVQFCANDPDILLDAARIVESRCDYVDINLGCPQRIARRGKYGAFLMDNLSLVKSLVEKLARNLRTPVSCKMRIFPDLEDTLKYAKMLEEAGCALLAVHGRTRGQKDSGKSRADWKTIRAVKNTVGIPVLANGNIRDMRDVTACLEETAADGVLSAESLLMNPAIFSGFTKSDAGDIGGSGDLDPGIFIVEYLKLCEEFPVPWRMIRSHTHRMLGAWLRVHPKVRDDLNSQSTLTFQFLYGLVDRLKKLGSPVPRYHLHT